MPDGCVVNSMNDWARNDAAPKCYPVGIPVNWSNNKTSLPN